MPWKLVELVSHLTILRFRQILIADFSKGMSCSNNIQDNLR